MNTMTICKTYTPEGKKRQVLLRPASGVARRMRFLVALWFAALSDVFALISRAID